MISLIVLVMILRISLIYPREPIIRPLSRGLMLIRKGWEDGSMPQACYLTPASLFLASFASGRPGSAFFQRPRNLR